MIGRYDWLIRQMRLLCKLADLPAEPVTSLLLRAELGLPR